MIETPGWFGPSDSALFGWFCLPDDGRASLGVLLCPPIGEEEHNSHETFRRLAETLADRGIASLRFDHHGTGDSLGRWSDPDRGDAWLAGVQEAFDALRGLGAVRTAAMGMRIGATLLAVAAQRGLIDPAALVLWDPCSGRNMLREGQARRPSQVPPPPGAVDTPGYLYDEATVEDLRTLDLSAVDPSELAPHLLVLTRDDRPVPKELRSWTEDPGVEWADAIGQSELLDLPMTDNSVPTVSLAHVANWLGAHASDASVPVAAGPCNAISLPAAPDGSRLTESVVSLGAIGMFGIVTDPEGPARGPLIVLINVANDRHVGPGRRWVDCARAWAGMGFRVVRVDQTGAGDSPCHDGQEFGVLYAREWLDDLPDALRSPLCAGSDVALISLCSGAYSAMETALQVPVSILYPINVILHAKVTGATSALADPRRRAARPQLTPFARFHDRCPRAGALLWRAFRQLAVRNAPMATVSDLVRRGTAVVLVMSPNDGRHFSETLYWSLFRAWRWRRAGRFRLIVDRRIDHALMTQEGQEATVRTITDDLVARYPSTAPLPTRRMQPADASDGVR